MKSVSAEYMTALTGAPERGVVPRRLVTIYAKERDTGLIVRRGLWTGDDDVDLDVISGTTGTVETRSFFGGVGLVVGDIARVSDLTIQTVNVEMSQISEITQQLVRGYDVRLAKVEIHDLLLDTRSRAPVAPGEITFLGEVDGAPIETPAAGGMGRITLRVRSDAISMLARTNPQKASYEGQKRRANDQWGKYKATSGSWEIPWGQ